MVVGVDVAAESGKGGVLVSLASDALPGERSVVIGKVLANRLDVDAGQLIAVIGQDADGFPTSDLFTVKAIIGGNLDLIKTMGVVMAFPAAAEFLSMPDQAHEIIVQGDDYHNAEALAATVKNLPALADTEVLSWKQAVPELAKMFDLKGWMDMIFVAIVFVAAAAGIANTSMMSAFERTHEFGMLLAVGARPGRIVLMVLIEAVVLGLVGVAIGSVLGSALVLLTSQTGINYAMLAGSDAEEVAFGGLSLSFIIYPVFELRHAVFGLCSVTLTSILASLWPAALAARLEPVEAMRA